MALYDGDLKVTLDAKLADEIIFDPEVLCRSSAILHRYGLADVASIHTALYDWKLAAIAIDESMNAEVFNQASRLVCDLVARVGEFNTTTAEGLQAIYEMVGESGHITNLYGSGRPESGSEHILAKVLEHGRTIPHGVSISLSIVMTSILQNNQPEMVARLIRGVGALEGFDDNVLTRSEIISALIAVKPRADRYSVIDEINIKRSLATDIVDQTFTALGLK